MINVLRRERQRDIGVREKKRRHRGEGNVKMKPETGVMQPHKKECLEPPETGRGKKEFSIRTSEGSETRSTLDFSLLASGTVRK